MTRFDIIETPIERISYYTGGLWPVILIVLAAAVVAILLLVRRKRKKKK